MKNETSYKMIIHSDLVSDFDKGTFNAFKTDDSFSFKELDRDIKDQICNYEIIEYVFEGIQSKRNQEYYSAKLNLFERGVHNIIAEDHRTKYVVGMSHRPENISRLRSYKGLIDKKKIEIADFFEKENSVGEGRSVFIFIAKFSNRNADYLLGKLFDSSNCFMISSMSNLLNTDFLDKILRFCKIKRTSLQINYAALMLEFCRNDDLIYRIGGDAGEEYWSLQRFQKRASAN